MTKGIAGVICCALFLQFVPLDAHAITEQQWQEVRMSQMRNDLSQLEKGKVVEVKLKNKSKLKGYLIQIEQETFTICNRSGNIIVPFSEVQKVQTAGISNRAKFFIGLGVGVGSMILLARILLPNT